MLPKAALQFLHWAFIVNSLHSDTAPSTFMFSEFLHKERKNPEFLHKEWKNPEEYRRKERYHANVVNISDPNSMVY